MSLHHEGTEDVASIVTIAGAGLVGVHAGMFAWLSAGMFWHQEGAVPELAFVLLTLPVPAQAGMFC